LREQLVGVRVRPVTDLTAIVGQHGFDLGVMCLEGRDDIGVYQRTAVTGVLLG
jgi:hypothetical protein